MKTSKLRRVRAFRARDARIYSSRGSAILAAVLFSFMFAMIAGLVFSIANQGHKRSLVNDERMRARAVAESELERMYFEFISLRLKGIPADKITEQSSMIALADISADPTTERTAFLKTHQDQKWQIKRSIRYERQTKGVIPNTSDNIGDFSYLTAKVSVQSPVYDVVTIKLGRRLISAASTIFQNSLFYNGDLEIYPADDYTLDGDVVCNGNIYACSTGTGELIIKSKIKYGVGCAFNGSKDVSVIGDTYRKVGTGKSFEPTWNALVGGRTAQLSELEQSQNFLGGLNAKEIQVRRSDLFATENDVYRAMIVPPPDLTPSNPGEYPSYTTGGDDDVIASLRLYNRASIIVNVETDGSVNITEVNADKSQHTYADSEYTDFVVGGNSYNTFYDFREKANVRIVTLDIAKLKTLLAGGVHNDFNGVVYINQRVSTLAIRAGVKLINANVVPEALAANASGFTVATNGAIYVVGNFNHVKDDATFVPKQAALLGDAVTLLTAGWPSTDWASSDTIEDGKRNAFGTETTLRAGIVTGNTPSDSTDASGGAQNLVRLMEAFDLDGGPGVTNFSGSFGCTFASKMFTGKFVKTTVVPAVFTAPTRSISFDNDLRNNPPTGTPETTLFSRGTLFTW